MAKKKQEVKLKEPVRIRFKQLANGNQSIYLDYYTGDVIRKENYVGGKRQYEFLKLYLIPEKTREDKAKNEATLALAKAIQSKRIVELQNDAHGFQNTNKSKANVIDYLMNMRSQSKERGSLNYEKTIGNHEALPEIMSQLEQTMEEKFYHPDVHVFNNEASDSQPVNAETQDSRLMEKISEDISRKDVEQLKKHFECLVKKYENDTRFSAMYVKFVFSNVIQELFQENQFSEERKLDHEVERLYSCTNLKQILAITQENIKEYEEFLERSMSDSRDEVASVKNYIYQHYAEDLSLETLAEKVYLSSGYLSFIFKKETGMNLNRFIRVVRMEKAKELLCNSDMKVAQVSEQVGIPNVSYFCRSFREYYGSSPESYRKGTGEEDENTGSHKE